MIIPLIFTLLTLLSWLLPSVNTSRPLPITLQKSETIAPKTLSYSGKKVSISLKGDSTERRVSVSTTDSLFTVGTGGSLTLDNNLTLQGRSDNTASLIRVNSGGTLVMNTGSQISGSSASSNSYGGGVFVYGTFTKESGGTIYRSNASSTLKNTITSGNAYGHAVCVDSSPAKRRDITAGAGVTLNSGVSGSAGGWE